MEMIVALALWYVIALAGLVYWWHKRFDLEVADLLFFSIAAFMGPIAWPVGWALYKWE